MRIQLILLLIAVMIGFVGCQPYNDASLKQRISELKDEIENSKTVTPVANTPNSSDMEVLLSSMNKSFKDSLEAIVSKIQASSPLTETKIDELNKEVIRLSILVSKLEIEKDKRIEFESEIEKFSERLNRVENAVVKVENDTLKKHFETQNEILKKLSEMVENVSNTAPAEVTKQLQAQYDEMVKKLGELEASKTKLEEDLKTAKEDIEKKDKRIDILKSDKEMLEKAINELKKGTGTEEKDTNDTEIPKAGVITGSILEIKMTSSDTYSAIVTFPAGTKVAEDFLLSVFNEKGEKIGRFKVTMPNLKSSTSDEAWVGGVITALKGVLEIKKGYRVSTMLNMPDLTNAGN